MKWVNATKENLPTKLVGIIFRQTSTKIVLSISTVKGWIEDEYFHDLEWLDETDGLEDKWFNWQQKLARITGIILGLRKVLIDYEVTPEQCKEISKDLSKVADDITEVMKLINTNK